MSLPFNDLVKSMQPNTCEYCKSKDNKMFIFKFIEGENSERAVYIEKDNYLVMAVCNDKGWEAEGDIKINYCPMCGKKLNKE